MTVRRLPILLTALMALAGAAATAHAQEYRGVDGFLLVRGGELMQPVPATAEPLTPGSRSIDEALTIFRQYCLRARFMPEMMGFIDFPEQLDLTPRPTTLDDGTEVTGWHAGDISLMIVDTPDGRFGRQCAMTLATTVNHTAQEMFPVINNVFGGPANYDDLVNEDGTQNPDVRPIWLATTEMNGGPVFTLVRSLSNASGGYRTHFAMFQIPEQ